MFLLNRNTILFQSNGRIAHLSGKGKGQTPFSTLDSYLKIFRRNPMRFPAEYFGLYQFRLLFI
jgi:hypothetical protein